MNWAAGLDLQRIAARADRTFGRLQRDVLARHIGLIPSLDDVAGCRGHGRVPAGAYFRTDITSLIGQCDVTRLGTDIAECRVSLDLRDVYVLIRLCVHQARGRDGDRLPLNPDGPRLGLKDDGRSQRIHRTSVAEYRARTGSMQRTVQRGNGSQIQISRGRG